MVVAIILKENSFTDTESLVYISIEKDINTELYIGIATKSTDQSSGVVLSHLEKVAADIADKIFLNRSMFSGLHRHKLHRPKNAVVLDAKTLTFQEPEKNIELVGSPLSMLLGHHTRRS